MGSRPPLALELQEAEGAPLGDHHLEMAERLAEVLALTVESFRTEQMIFSLFARALPDLLGADAPTSLRESLAQYIHALRLGPTYKERLQLALAVGKLCDRGPAEAMLCAEVLARIDAVERVTGRARYTRDIELPGMLFARILRSPHPHARIRAIDVSKAKALPLASALALSTTLPPPDPAL